MRTGWERPQDRRSDCTQRSCVWYYESYSSQVTVARGKTEGSSRAQQGSQSAVMTIYPPVAGAAVPDTPTIRVLIKWQIIREDTSVAAGPGASSAGWNRV